MAHNPNTNKIMFRPRQQPPPPPQQQQQQLAVLPEVSDVAALVVRGATRFAKTYKLTTGFYLFGIVVLLFFSAGLPLTLKQRSEYEKLLNSIDLQAEEVAVYDYWRAREAYHATKGWFFSCDSLCQRNRARMQKAEQHLAEVRAESAARVSDAKAVAGLFSEVGVEEAKQSFWQYFTAGKAFAKRQSMWDMMFIGIRSMTRGRDETWAEFALKVLLQVLLNMSMGLIMALIFFVTGLFSIVRGYQANPLVAVAFFLAASAAAFAFVASYLLAVYGAAAGGVYGMLKLAETSQRAALADQRRRDRLAYGQERPHYD